MNTKLTITTFATLVAVVLTTGPAASTANADYRRAFERVGQAARRATDYVHDHKDEWGASARNMAQKAREHVRENAPQWRETAQRTAQRTGEVIRNSAESMYKGYRHR